jgi:hypothetical protein
MPNKGMLRYTLLGPLLTRSIMSIKHAAFQLQVGDQQEGSSPLDQLQVFPNGQAACVDAEGFFESIVPFSRDELARYDFKNNPQGKDDLEIDICLRATGSIQLSHRTVTRVGQLPNGNVLFHLRFSQMLVPHEDARTALATGAAPSQPAQPPVPAPKCFGEFEEDQLWQAANQLVTKWVFPCEDSFDTPSVDVLARASKLERLLMDRMRTLASESIDPCNLSIAELLPGLNPSEIELTEADIECM